MFRFSLLIGLVFFVTSFFALYGSDLEILQAQYERIVGMEKEANLLYQEIKEKEIQYIHEGYASELDQVAVQLQKIENDLTAVERVLENSSQSELVKKSYKFALMKLQIFSRLCFLAVFDQSYMTARFFNEGSIEGLFPKDFYKTEYNELRILISELKRIESEFPNQNELPSGEDAEVVKGILNFAMTVDLPQKGQLSQIKKQNDTFLDKMGNSIAGTIVNILGQIMKKRDFIPKIRLESNFRENYLFEKRENVLKELLSPERMLPGDIIIEKDLMANSDYIIPGYWIHASAYLGTIHDLKRMNLWDAPEFRNIRQEIEDYRTIPKKIRLLEKEYKNTYAFDEIPWFIESDRPGVGVHPLQKFLQTDGMAVLRPTKNWNENAVIETIKRFNKYIHFPYDYTHNVRNKMSVTCSKLILHVYDGITFPTSHNLNYVTVDPDQIAAPISTGPFVQDGQLQLIMFFDAYKKGALQFIYNERETFNGYWSYVATLPHGVYTLSKENFLNQRY